MLSIKEALISLVMAEGWESFSLKMDSTSASSVEVVSCPVKAHQSLTTIPAPITSVPRLTVPATRGICRIEFATEYAKTSLVIKPEVGS